MCNISYVDPHDPYDPPAPYDTMFDAADMPYPLPTEWEGISAFERARQRFHRFDQFSADVQNVRRMRALYHGSIRLIDDQIGRIVQFLRDRGLVENTILCFTTDHGDMMGDHGLITKGLMHYDKSARVPFIVWGADTARGQVCDRLTTSLDLFPTLCQWGGARVLPPYEGRSLVSVCRGEAEPNPWEEITIQVMGARSIVTAEGWRLSLLAEDRRGQLFDLFNDPDEQRDLYGQPDVLAKQIELLERHNLAFLRSMQTWRYDRLTLCDGRRLMPGQSLPLSEPLQPTYPEG